MNKQFKINHQTGVNWNVQPVKKRCPNHNIVECSNVVDKKRCLKYQCEPEDLFCPYIEYDKLEKNGLIEIITKPREDDICINVITRGKWEDEETVIPDLEDGEDCPEGNM